MYGHDRAFIIKHLSGVRTRFGGLKKHTQFGVSLPTRHTFCSSIILTSCGHVWGDGHLFWKLIVLFVNIKFNLLIYKFKIVSLCFKVAIMLF